jgi:hypothetical protein
MSDDRPESTGGAPVEPAADPQASPNVASATPSREPRGEAYQAQLRTSPLVHLFFVAVILLVAGLLWQHVEQESSTALNIWVGVCVLTILGVAAWTGVELVNTVRSRRGMAVGFVAVTVTVGALVLGFVSWANHRYRSELPSLDLTASREYSLSEASERLLDEVKGTIHAAYLEQASGNPSFREKAKDQLRLYERASARVKVSVFDDYREKDRVTEWLRTNGVNATTSGETGDSRWTR